MPNKINGIEALIDLFIAELLRTLDRFGDPETTIDIHRIASRSIAALVGVQAKAQDQARLLLEQVTGQEVEADNGIITWQKVVKVNESEWSRFCGEYSIYQDAQARLDQARLRVVRLQKETGCRAEEQVICIRYKED